jgi:plasmid stabilization system protein ParE
MNTNIEITAEAEQDISSIITNIKLQHPAIVRQTINELKKQFQLLAARPDVGRVGGHDGTREVVIPGLPYIAIYERNAAGITIVRVLAGTDDKNLAA